MQNKKNLLFGLALVGCWAVATPSVAEDTFVESDDVIIEEIDEQASMDNVAADAISNYSADGSLFQQITNLEQEKINYLNPFLPLEAKALLKRIMELDEFKEYKFPADGLLISYADK